MGKFFIKLRKILNLKVRQKYCYNQNEILAKPIFSEAKHWHSDYSKNWRRMSDFEDER